MNHLIKKSALLGCLFLAINSYAEDIELYVGSASTTQSVNPNILFIVDTSGSMSNSMEITIPQVIAGPTVTTTTGDLIVQDFNAGIEGWSGSVTNFSNQLRFTQDIVSLQVFDFGVAHANETVQIKFELYVNSKWEISGGNQDYFEITANGVEISKESYDPDETTNVSATFDLDASGQVTITLKANTTYSDEYALIDNLKIGNVGTSTPFAYNNANTYDGCHDDNQYYFASSAANLSCSDTAYQSRFIKQNDNKCQFLEDILETSGYAIGLKALFFKDDYSQSKKDRWVNVTSSETAGGFDLECYNDRGVHGKSGGSSDKYIAKRKKGGPWKDNTTNEVNWSEVPALNYFGGNYLNYLDCVSVGGCSTSTGGTTGTTTTTTGGSTTTPQTVTRTRLEVAQYVINDIISTASNVNIGLMRFDSYSRGSFVVTAMDDIANNKVAFKTELDKMKPAGGTPLAESLYESYLYYKGLAMRHGVNPRGNRYRRDSTDATAHNNNVYDSPIEFQCQKSFVVLLTDGQPTGDANDDNLIEAIPGFSVKTGSSSCGGNCLDEMAEMLFKTDMASSLSSDQLVTTYTIAMGDDLGSSAVNLLQNTAAKGGGAFYQANDYIELLDAFTNILNSINAVNSTFVAPTLSVNAFSNTTHRNELYFSLFKPQHGPHWAGNLKKFELKIEDNTVVIIDANENNAIDPQTGTFYENAQSFWPTQGQLNDGNNVSKGGAAAKIIKDRAVYTNIAGNTLTSAGNAVKISNLASLKAEINPALSDEETTNIIKWARGFDPQNIRGAAPTEVARREMGDISHSRPVIVQYGGTEADPIQTIYTSNNDGFLNAIDEETGVLLWSFIPKELLTNLDVLYEDNDSISKIYGLDGFISVKKTDGGLAGTIGSGDQVVLYIGMRRGGKNYYAVDVTSREVPKLLWTIKGGTGDFSELAQTWSEPLVKQIKINGTLKDVLIFGGGYDTGQDSNNTHEDDSEGRAIYIVDALNGSRIWWAGPTGSGADLELATLTNSIPATISTINLNKEDGVTRLYAADTRGQIFRIDINLENSGTNTLVDTAYRLAKLSDENSNVGTRRTYYPPALALMNGYIAVVIGTGYRSHPLDVTEQNRIYMIKDVDVFDSPAAIPDTIFASDLVDTYILPSSTTELAQRSDELANAKGWYFNLDAGEKILSKALITSGKALLTSFTPNNGGAASSCSPSSGGGKLYILDLATSGAVVDSNGDGVKSREDTSSTLKTNGPPPGGIIIVRPEGSVPYVTGSTDLSGLLEKKKSEKTYWYEDKSGTRVDNAEN